MVTTLTSYGGTPPTKTVSGTLLLAQPFPPADDKPGFIVPIVCKGLPVAEITQSEALLLSEIVLITPALPEDEGILPDQSARVTPEVPLVNK